MYIRYIDITATIKVVKTEKGGKYNIGFYIFAFFIVVKKNRARRLRKNEMR